MNLEREILKSLDQYHPYVPLEKVMLAELRLIGVGENAAKDALEVLKRKDQVLLITTEDDVRWKITTAGRARLCE